MAAGIGIENESTLHRHLKLKYAGRRGKTEVEVSGFIADAVDAAGRFIEIQTTDFSKMRKKAGELAALGGLTVVYPVALDKYIETFDSNGRQVRRRRSGRRGSPWDVFTPLVHAPELPLVANLSIEIALAAIAEERVMDGKGSWRRKGVSIQDRRLLEVRDTVCLEKPCDYLRFIPFTRKDDFTVALLGEKAGISTGLAGKALYVLSKIGIVRRVGKKGNAYVYRLQATSRTKKWKKKP
jgi:hypothetical protein